MLSIVNANANSNGPRKMQIKKKLRLYYLGRQWGHDLQSLYPFPTP